MTEAEVNDDAHIWHVLSEREIGNVLEKLGETMTEGFTEEQAALVLYELVETKVGNVLLYLTTIGELTVYATDDKRVFFSSKTTPTSKLDLVPGQRLKYSRFGQEQLKKTSSNEVVFARWIENRTACMLRVKDSQGEISTKKYLRDYLDFLVPVKPPPPPLETDEDWSI